MSHGSEVLPLFVFGTLRQGGCNHHFLAGKFERMLPAMLPGYQRTHPLMIDVAAGQSVPGELYYLKPALYARTMARCDWLEGLPPGKLTGFDYQRVPVTVETAEGPVRAWAYVHPQAV